MRTRSPSRRSITSRGTRDARGAGRPGAPHKRRLLPAVTTAATLAALVGTAAHTPTTQDPAERSLGDAGIAVSPAAAAAAETVELKRHYGTITGDGQTVYIANRTEFRPRRTVVALPPRVRARAWVVVDLDTGRLIGKHEARAHLPQASTLKLLTAVTAVRTVPADVRHKVTRFEAGQICSCAGLRRGSRYSRATLLAGMLLPSGNDAAEALAGAHPHGRRAFYRAMNRNAERLGATDTVARNASGLTATGSHSSARDLVLFLRAALAQEKVRDVLAMRKATIATVAGKYRHTVWRGTDYVNKYDGSLGKSGWTTPAKNTLVVATEMGDHTIAVASLGAPTGYSTSGARALTEWAADNIDGLRAVGRLPHS